MTNELTKNQQNEVVIDYSKTATEYLRGMGLNLPPKYENQFLEICKAFNLNPFKREIYAVGYGNNFNIITGYEVYLKRAERTGKLDGWECHIEKDGNSKKAVLTIYRKDWKMPFTHEVYYDEAVAKTRDGEPTSIWKKMPSFMLKKVAIAQGFRLCFPDELGGMPYTNDELEGEQMHSEKTIKNITPLAEEVREVEEVSSSDMTEQEAQQVSVFFDNTAENSSLSPKERLEKVCTEYANYLQGQPLNMATAVLNSDNPSESDLNSMYDRCITYLSRKGVRVA